jgi:hypothetical protein
LGEAYRTAETVARQVTGRVQFVHLARADSKLLTDACGLE